MVKNRDDLSLKQQVCVRLKQLRIARGFTTAKAFALKHRLKVSTYSLHEAGTRAMSFQIIEHYCQLLNIDKDWLLTGEGEAHYVKAQAVPIIEWDEIALFPDKLDLINRSHTPLELELPAPSFAVKVQDDSMEPRYPRGALLFIDIYQIPGDREYALFSTPENTIVFKQHLEIDGKLFMRSLNADEPPQKMTSKIKVLGKVVQAKIIC